jgi:hypothetical protein
MRFWRDTVTNWLAWYWRTPASLLEVNLWVALSMVLGPALLVFSDYASWAFKILIPVGVLLGLRILRQLWIQN